MPPDVDVTATAVTACGPLVGVRVLDLSTLVAGPAAARYLADFGADVVKIEAPAGDTARALGAGPAGDPDSYYWKVLGRNKRSVVIDLKHGPGRARLERLVSRSDVLIENMRVGKMEQLGLGPNRLHELNPKLVMLRVSGFGRTGAHAARPGFATTAEAMSGFVSLNGEPGRPPLLPPIALTDEIAGLAGAFAVMLGLWSARTTGVGQVADVNLLDTIVQVMGPLVVAFTDCGYLQPRMGSALPYSVPRGVYPTQDGRWVALSTSAEPVARRLLRHLGVEDDPRFADVARRSEHRADLELIVGNWTATRTADQLLGECADADLAVALVNTIEDLVADPHVRTGTTLANASGFTMQGLIAQLGATPGAVRTAGPTLGADSATFDDWLEHPNRADAR